ncbi:penicillin acylase family protein [Methylocapsa acidiphila]|uniref:penicillin acylase family protein n=1 Tax=Methylocapsa acidiphila TaxID=133552 RepID=UPI0018DE0C98|nr:penicillin acylase family protein [Methylocapsa acidiphila]
MSAKAETAKKMRRFFGLFVPAAVIIVGALAAFVIYAIRAPLPDDDGFLPLPGLRAPVEVAFDDLGTPKITAQNRHDAFQALGFVTARDRLFQMDLMRRQTAGRLAEIFGGATLEMDRWNRVMGFGRLAEDILPRLPAAQREALEAYAAGVNQAIASARMPAVEFTLLNYRPEPWRPQDSILIVLGMQSLLTWSAEQERTATVMRRALPRSVVDFLTPESDCYNEEIAPRDPGRCAADALPLHDLIEVMNEAHAPGSSALHFVSGFGNPRGSNAWVVGPAKTTDGRAILANDMHLELSVPDVWYRAEWRYPGANLSGLTLPGVPLLIAGSNGALAWGLTSVEGDFVDLVQIDAVPNDPDQYQTPVGARSFESRIETIHIRGGADLSLQVQATIWGPLLPEPLLGHRVSAHWTALDPAATDLGLGDLAEATTAAAAIAALHRAGGLPLNVLLADSAGNIAWTYAGKFPNRRGMDGLFSESWADGRKGWDGYIPAEELPSLINPPSGFLVNANQRMLGGEYPTVIGHDFSGGYRAWRISRRLQALNRVGERDMLALQLDAEADFYRYYQKAALRALEGEDALGPLPAADLARAIAGWNGRAETGSLGVALLAAFREELVEAVLAPLLAKCRELDPTFFYGWTSADLPVQRIIDSGRAELLPDRQRFRDWPSFLRSALLSSAQKLAARQNVEIGALPQLSWGEVNKVEIRHPLADGLPVLRGLLDMPREPLAGCGNCVRLANGKFGASERLVVAPGHEADGILHIPGGQSGQFGSRHYSDQQKSWLEGLPTEFSNGEISHRLTLEPRP